MVTIVEVFVLLNKFVHAVLYTTYGRELSERMCACILGHWLVLSCCPSVISAYFTVLCYVMIAMHPVRLLRYNNQLWMQCRRNYHVG